MSTSKYSVGQTLTLAHWDHTQKKAFPCRATILGMWRPAHKKNSHMFRVHVYTHDNQTCEQFFETANLTSCEKRAAELLKGES